MSGVTTVSFTGTRRGMTLAQKRAVGSALAVLQPDVFHHGDCVGADAEAHVLAETCPTVPEILIHPSSVPGTRAFCRGHKVFDEKPPLVRNLDMVKACDVLIACPAGQERRRSGTWATVRAARKEEGGPNILVVMPDGTLVEETAEGRLDKEGSAAR